MSHPLFGPEIREMIQERDDAGLKAFCESLHPATVADALEDLPPDQVWQAISPTDIRTQAAIFEYLPMSRQVEMVEGAARPQLGQLIGKMSHDDRVDLLRRLPTRVKESLLRLVDEADRRDIATLFELGENTVGALMTTDYAWLPPTLTAAEAIDQLRQQAPDRETIYYIYILDEPHRRQDGAAVPRRLLGVITLRDLILAPRFALLKDLMETDIISLQITSHRQEAADLLARYDFIAIPVLDEHGGMVGIVTHDDVIDVLKAEATEDLQRQAAVGLIEGSYLEAGFLSVWRKRTMWLSLLFGAGLFTGKAMEFFGPAIEAVKVLAFFVPLCIATGGNSGTQAATLITRALALGEIKLGDWLRVLWHELRMGLAMGFALSFLALVPSMIVGSDSLVANGEPFSRLKLAFVLGQAVMMICLFGTLIGSMLPLILKRLGVDPALASSPFVSTTVDVSGIMIYFAIANLYLL